jgi:hypothetical protein
MSQELPADGVDQDGARNGPWHERHRGALIWIGIGLVVGVVTLLVVKGPAGVSVGACLLRDVKSKVTVVACSDPAAAYRVVGELESPDEARRKVLGAAPGAGSTSPVSAAPSRAPTPPLSRAAATEARGCSAYRPSPADQVSHPAHARDAPTGDLPEAG